MKKVVKTIVATVMILSLVVASVNNAKAQFSASISIQTFYSELSPYGQWVDDPQYGYVWIPGVQRGFRPYYTGGHWVMTSYGLMWVSDYSWGWAPFHYGRWLYTSYYGWVWIPDTTWGPSWVTWRWGGDYCGWAPLGPGISVNFAFGSGYSVPNDWWVFVPQRYCLSTSFYNYAAAPQSNITYIRNTTIINNTYVNNNVTYAAGPRINDIQRATGKSVSVYNVANVGRPGKTSVQGNAVRIYRPQVTGAKGTPPAVVSKDQFLKNKTPHNAGVSGNNGRNQQIGRNRSGQQNNNAVERNTQTNRSAQRTVQKNISKAERRQQMNHQPQLNQQSQQMERKQVRQQNNNRNVMPERRQQISQPPQQMERKQVRQQNNNQNVMPERRQQISQPPQVERRQMPQQKNNPNMMPERRQQISQPSPQQGQQQPKPGNRGKGKGNN